MKKFLIYLSVILVAVSLGFTVFYLTRNNEQIYISTSSVYMREGEEIDDLSIVWKNKKAFSEYEVLSSNDKIAKYDKETGKLTAVGGGIATITFRTSSVKFRNLSCQVYVGDGSLTNPYYITTAEQLRQIGAYNVDDVTDIEYGLDKCYRLVSNIDLLDGYNNTGFWIPIGTGNANGFTGSFDGNGYTISNVSVDKQKLIEEIGKLDNVEPNVKNYNTFVNCGLFNTIGVNGRVCNLKVNNIIIHGNYVDGYAGGIAGKNFGTIERSEVINSHFDVLGCDAIGGIAGLNGSGDNIVTVQTDEGSTSEYVRYTARIDRCASQVTMGITKEESLETPTVIGVQGHIGGIAGTNEGGIIIYSYSTGDVYLNTKAEAQIVYGGIVGINAVKNYAINPEEKYMYDYSGAHVKDCYSVITLQNGSEVNDDAIIGGVIGFNQDKKIVEEQKNTEINTNIGVNKIIGNYYNSENLNYVEVSENSDEEVVVNYTGVGKNMLNDAVVTAADKQYFVIGKTSAELKLDSTYVSHIETKRVWNEDEQEYEVENPIIPWKFNIVWFIKENLNDGYPYLNFANIEVDDDLIGINDGTTIKTIEELKNIKLDGQYIIAQNIDAGGEVWVPIGTYKRPFIGKISAGRYIRGGVEKYYTISNLKTTQTRNEDEALGAIELAGLFGVTSGDKSGYIENITLVNPYFVNGTISGGIVASNGFTTQKGEQIVNIPGMAIKNCKVLGGTIKATQNAGGIVGNNFGAVSGCVVADSSDEYENITELNIILYSTGDGEVGGVVGYNNPNAVVSGCTIGGKVLVKAESGEGKVATVEVGGIAGHNDGNITNAIVSNTKGITISNLMGSVGGIAGINAGKIEKVVVSTEISAPTNNDQVFAGGIAGKLVSEAYINIGLVRKGSVTGYNAGGLVGYVSYSKPNYYYSFKPKTQTEFELGANDLDTISQSTVVDFSVVGEICGGLAATVDNGIIRNCYTQATLYGVSKNSTKAGFVVNLNLNKQTVGLIINCYASVTFNKENGTNYAVTPKEIYKDPIINFDKVTALQRNAGYCYNFVYNKDSGGKEPETGNLIGDLFNKWFKEKSLPSATQSEMQGTSEKFVSRNFSTDVWYFDDAKMPELLAINELIKAHNITFN